MTDNESSQGNGDMKSAGRAHNTLVLGGETPVLAVWGGIGFTRRPLRDLRDLYGLHRQDLADFVQHCGGILKALQLEEGGDMQIDLVNCVTATGGKLPVLPAGLTMVATTVLQMARYVVLCKKLGKTPRELAKCFTAFAGHSVGLTVAVAMAAADSWSSLYELAEMAIKGNWYAERHANAVWAGAMVSQDAAAAECVRRGEGAPSHMLSIAGSSRDVVEKEIETVNRSVQSQAKIYIGLINDTDSFVASGGPDALVTLCGRLRTPTTSGPASFVDELQIRPGFRRPPASLQFIPAIAPFHSPHLLKTVAAMTDKIDGAKLGKDQMLVPVWGLDALLDSDSTSPDNLGPALSKLILSRQVDWPRIMENLSGRWQVLDFGPGGSSGVGAMISRMKTGSGTKTYAVCPASSWTRGSPDNVQLLSAISTELNPPAYTNVKIEPRLTTPDRGATGGEASPSRFTELFGLSRVLVAGMTPTTCDVDLVAAVMNAGFYAELATGGYYDAASLAMAIRRLAQLIPEGRLITVNVIYANPQGLSWIIPQLAALVREGCPIGGLTIGAGVPAPEVAAEYIRTLELSYISFKPASVAAIDRVLDIARAHATLPVILQWTGGRAGGHHSIEDFHQPMLESYQVIRELPNVVLVAGSGFGDVEGSWPYISGEWSRKFARPPMPFDAILIGTCIMTTKEARTSGAAKRAMVDTPGLPDSEWPHTMRPGGAGAGGVISIISQLGEAMHVVATRGMRLWAELDETLFNQPKEKMLELIRSRRAYLIARLNADYQKVWFGVDYASGEPVELADMTYEDVLKRLIELLHPARKGDWTHPSYQRVFDDFTKRTVERFHGRHAGHHHGPHEELDALMTEMPGVRDHLLTMEDTHYFVYLCRRRGQRAVPFIAVLDSDFAVWFKKDSLWQSEDLESTHHGDVGRVCILCGPVAVQSCQSIDLPVGGLLRNIEQGYLDKEAQQRERGRGSVAHRAGLPLYEEHELVHAIGSSQVLLDDKYSVQLADDIDPNSIDGEPWFLLIGSRLGQWGRRLFSTKKLVSAGRAYDNPVRRIFAARPGALVRFLGKNGAELYDSASPSALIDARLSIDGDIVTAVIFSRCTRDNLVKELVLRFHYDCSRPYAPFSEETDHRTRRMCDFYQGVLLGGENSRPAERRLNVMRHDPFTVKREQVLSWQEAVDGSGVDAMKQIGANGEVPVEYITLLISVATWRHLLTWDWDLSGLLHQHTTVQILKGHRMLSVGDAVTLTSSIRALHNRESGIEVGVHFTFEREGEVFADLDYVFMVLGERASESECFETGALASWTLPLRTGADVEAVLAKPWLRPRPDAAPPLAGQTMVLELRRDVSYRPGVGCAAKTWGEVWIRDGDGPNPPWSYGTVEHVVVGHNNDRTDVVANFLKTAAVRGGKPTPLAMERTKRTFNVSVSDNSAQYAKEGGDYNPIHMIPAFARLVGFKEPIWHGNHTVALVLRLIRREIPGASSATLRRYDCAFLAVVSPGGTLSVALNHVGTDDGGAVIDFLVRREGSGELVLSGVVNLTAPPAAFLFTGQGSQFTGMGLDMVDQSDASRHVWADADRYFENDWGFSIIDIVRRNPTKLTVNFCGRQGIKVRQNYLDMQWMLGQWRRPGEAGLFEGLHVGSRSYTITHEDGLLSMTQFTQPAIFVVEKAAFEHLKALARVPLDARFAGHSLGEFSAIGCMTSALPLAAALKTVFVRGALMQAAVPRNLAGRSGFAMVAVDPSRVNKECQEEHILSLVNEIADATGLLLETVNFNVSCRQYVCAGDKRCLELLQKVVDDMHGDPLVLGVVGWQKRLVAKHKLGTDMDATSAFDVTLTRGKATIPLKGIDVPFHSSQLATVRQLFRRTLVDGIAKAQVTPESLVGKWIPNVTGVPFALDRNYVQLVARLTGSVHLETLAAGLQV